MGVRPLSSPACEYMPKRVEEVRLRADPDRLGSSPGSDSNMNKSGFREVGGEESVEFRSK